MEMAGNRVKESGRKRLSFLKNRSLIVLMVIIVISIAFQVGFYFWLESQSYDRYEHHYRVTITPNSSAPFRIICPVPVNSIDKTYPEFIDELRLINGSAIFTNITAPYGEAIEVIGTGEVKLEWEASWSAKIEEGFSNLSMTSIQYGIGSSWIYSDSSNLCIRVVLISTHEYQVPPFYSSVSEGPSFEIRGYLATEGWQQLPISVGWMVS